MNRAVLVVLLIAGCNAGSAKPGPPPPKSAAGSDTTPSVAPTGADPRPAGNAVGGPTPRDTTASIAQVARLEGKPLYLALCKPCHGADGKGYAADHAPSLVNPTFLESASDDFLRSSIAAGRPGTSMAAYGATHGGPLDDAGVDRLVRYLRGLGPAAKPLPEAAVGNPAIGAMVYARRCVSCHGDAKTRGEAVSLNNPAFQAAVTAPFLRHAVVKGRPGTKMEAFAGTLNNDEIDGVVSYLRTLGSGAPAVALLPEPTGKEPLVLNPSGAAPHFTLRAQPCPPVPPGSVSGCNPDPRFVSVEQVAKALAARQRLVIIDARPTSEWRRVHITGAVSIPYHDMKRLDELAKDGTWVVAYCACPHHLSGIVVDELRKRGYTHTAVLDEGINDWHRRGFPVVAAEGVTRPPADPSAASPPPGAIR